MCFMKACFPFWDKQKKKNRVIDMSSDKQRSRSDKSATYSHSVATVTLRNAASPLFFYNITDSPEEQVITGRVPLTVIKQQHPEVTGRAPQLVTWPVDTAIITYRSVFSKVKGRELIANVNLIPLSSVKSLGNNLHQIPASL